LSEEIPQAEKIYDEYRNILLDRQLSNSEKYDGALLSLSTGVLSLSLAFIKDIVPIGDLIIVWVLIASWALFAISIILTITSYITSQKGISTQLEYAEEYYLKGNKDYLNKENPYSGWTECFNLSSGICFILALVVTILFVTVNLYEAMKMSEKKSDSVPIFDGAVIPQMRSMNSNGDIEQRGAPIPKMKPVPQEENTQPLSQPLPSDEKE
jgi:hypothetical protein